MLLFFANVTIIIHIDSKIDHSFLPQSWDDSLYAAKMPCLPFTSEARLSQDEPQN